MRSRKKTDTDEQPTEPADEASRGIDVNAVVSYNLKAIRERHGWTQQGVADRLGQLTGHVLPQASISAMERGFDGERRRRFDAHELYLLSVLFDVPIAYFFLPPPGSERKQLADTDDYVTDLYAALLGRDWQLAPIDDRLTEIGLQNPEEADQALAAVFGPETATGAWHDHFRTWRKKRLRQVERQYGDRLDEVAEFLADFAAQIKAVGPKTYLESMIHTDRDT
ncbi:MAG TPA: helix-turn-helix transcriptional regulator [Acidimicrobiales bacterium]|jgi:transcriptional regulator with XRE-family HTH domain|nr:helix-turn-helix transcriptional regulator [Acidimicrobiales bacterium]